MGRRAGWKASDLRRRWLDSKGLTAWRRLTFAVALFFAVVGVGTVGFVLLEKRSAWDSLYMTLVTVSTLGMAEGVGEVTVAGQFWIMVLIVVGIAGAMVALTVIVSLIVEGQVRSILGRRKVSMKIASLSGHYIVCGYGRVGRSLCADLAARKASVVVVDQDSESTTGAEANGLLYVLGNASEEAVLRDAGVEQAAGLVTALPTDADNVFVTLVARELNPKLFIAARGETLRSERRLSRAGANKTICPPLIGARRLANVLTRPGVVDFVDFATEGIDLEAEQYHLEAGNKLVGQSLRQANLPRQIGVLVVALRHGGGATEFNPDADTVLAVGDTLLVIGRTGSMAKLAQEYA